MARVALAAGAIDSTSPAASAAFADDAVGARYDAMVRRHYAGLCRFAYRYVRSREGAEDVVHEVLLRVWERAAAFDYDDPLPYLYQATRNRALSHLRHQRVHERWETAAIGEAADGMLRAVPDASHDVAIAELSVAISEAVDALPERCRAVFTLQREQGMSYAEIARTLGVAEKTVENQMGRALKALRRRLAPFMSVALVLVGGALTR